MQYPKIPLHGVLIGFFAAFVLLYSTQFAPQTRVLGQVAPMDGSSPETGTADSSYDPFTDPENGSMDPPQDGSSGSASSGSSTSGLFATCDGYEQTYRTDMTVSENETHMQVWARRFDELFQPIRNDLNNLQNGVDCSQSLRRANEQFTQIVQKYRCALADETLTGVIGSLAVLSRQDWAKDPEGTINFMKLLTYLNETQVQLQQATNTTNTTERYVQSFRCDVNVTLPSDLVIRLQGSSSSSSSPSDENFDENTFDENPPDDGSNDNPWDINNGDDGTFNPSDDQTGGGDQPPVDTGGGGDWGGQ